MRVAHNTLRHSDYSAFVTVCNEIFAGAQAQPLQMNAIRHCVHALVEESQRCQKLAAHCFICVAYDGIR